MALARTSSHVLHPPACFSFSTVMSPCGLLPCLFTSPFRGPSHGWQAVVEGLFPKDLTYVLPSRSACLMFFSSLWIQYKLVTNLLLMSSCHRIFNILRKNLVWNTSSFFWSPFVIIHVSEPYQSLEPYIETVFTKVLNNLSLVWRVVLLVSRCSLVRRR